MTHIKRYKAIESVKRRLDSEESTETESKAPGYPSSINLHPRAQRTVDETDVSDLAPSRNAPFGKEPRQTALSYRLVVLRRAARHLADADGWKTYLNACKNCPCNFRADNFSEAIIDSTLYILWFIFHHMYWAKSQDFQMNLCSFPFRAFLFAGCHLVEVH